MAAYQRKVPVASRGLLCLCSSWHHGSPCSQSYKTCSSHPRCGHTGETPSFPASHDHVNPSPLCLGTKPSSWSRPLSVDYPLTKQSSRLQRALQQVLPTRGSSSSHRRGAGSCLLLPGSVACLGNALNTGFHGKPGAWLLEVGRQLSQPGPSSETWPLAHTFACSGRSCFRTKR